MELTDDELKALERWRAGTYIKDEGRVLGQQTCMYDARKLADAMLRRYPVRTYGETVIRWDDPITPERLVACGWTDADGDYRATCDGSGLRYALTRPPHKQWALWLMNSRNEYEYDSYILPPRNMLEVWNLMERCGIKESGE